MPAEKPALKLHPMDVRQLVKDGKIAAARVEDNAFSIDRDVFDVLFPRLGLMPVEQAIYLQLYRHSFGRGLNCAQVSNAELQQLCSVSHSTARQAIRRLVQKKCVQLVRPGIQHEACIFRVFLPHEVLQYESSTKVSYRNLETNAVVSRALRAKPAPALETPVLHFNMLRS